MLFGNKKFLLEILAEIFLLEFLLIAGTDWCCIKFNTIDFELVFNILTCVATQRAPLFPKMVSSQINFPS